MLMISFKLNVLICLIAFFCCSCVDKATLVSNDNVFNINWDSVSAVRDTFLYSSVFDSVSIVALDEDVLVGEITKMQVYDNKLFILDSQKAKSLFVFGEDGKFLYKIGALGDAPGEYNNCSDFSINEQTGEVLIFDSHSNHIYIYNGHDGAYSRSLSISKDVRIQRIYCVENRLYAVNTYFTPLHQTEKYYILKQLNLHNGEIIGQWLDAEDYNKGWNDEFVRTNIFYPLSNRQTLFSFGISDSILCFSKGEIQPYLVFSGKRTITKQELAKFENNAYSSTQMRANVKIQAHLELGRMNKIFAINDVFEKNGMLYFDCCSWEKEKVQYDLQTRKVHLFGSNRDDVLFSVSPQNHTLPVFLTSTEKGVYYTVSSDFLPEIKYFAENKNLSPKVNNIKVLKGLHEDSNPVILFYGYK